MDAKLEVYTPAKAERILNNHNPANRSLREGIAEKYAEDMVHGKWTQCTAPIAFYEDGTLADGQHRLYALIESGTQQKFFTVTGLKKEDGLNIDTGLTRTLVDNGRISGLDTGLSNTLLSVARGIAEGQQASGRSKGLSNAQRLEMVEMHRDAAHWAVQHGPKGRGIRNAAVLAAVGRAYYLEQDHERLKRFCKVVESGFANGDSESSAVALRNYLIAHKGLVTSASWRDTYLKAQNAIHYFMRGRKLTVIKTVQDEAYPLPKNKRLAIAALAPQAPTQRGRKIAKKLGDKVKEK